MGQLVAYLNEDGATEFKPEDHHLTREQMERCLPARTHSFITPKLLDDLNQLIEDTTLRESFRDNLLGFGSILNDLRFSLRQYIAAIKYVTYKLMGDSNIAAYTKTFPERYQEMLDKGWNSKDIHSTISSYSKNQLVVRIFEQSIIPTWLLNQDLYQKALNTQCELMLSAKSEKVRCDAANSILTQLKMPEKTKVELDVNVKEDDSIAELKRTTMELVKQQRELIQLGAMSAREVAHQKIIEGEIIKAIDDD